MFDSRRPPVARAAVAALGLLTLNLSCGGSPSTSTPVTTPTPTAEPTATPTPPAASCPFGMGEFRRYGGCDDRDSTTLLPKVEQAIDKLIEERPGLFDLSNDIAPGMRAYRLLDKEAYLDGLVATLVALGLCAERDVDDPYQQTIRVKNSNEFSEDFDVVLFRNSYSFIRRGPGAYAGSCSPPNFPAVRPADVPPVGSGCYRPFPPPLYKMNCRDYLNGGDHHVIDSTPIVVDPTYCAAVGYTDGRMQCAIRPDGAPDRAACENWRVGTAQDTGRIGPTWTRRDEGTFCTDVESGCRNSPNSQYQLLAYKPGWYRVCSNKPHATTKGEVVCCDAQVDR